MAKVILIILVIVSWSSLVKSTAKIIMKTRKIEKLCRLCDLDGLNFLRIAISFMGIVGFYLAIWMIPEYRSILLSCIFLCIAQAIEALSSIIYMTIYKEGIRYRLKFYEKSNTNIVAFEECSDDKDKLVIMYKEKKVELIIDEIDKEKVAKFLEI